jgi:hypothetical protein
MAIAVRVGERPLVASAVCVGIVVLMAERRRRTVKMLAATSRKAG